MPFTPFHFGPHACVSLPFYRKIDIPVFLGANIAVDLEPLIVMLFDLNYPLHGYCHTFLIGGIIGFIAAVLLWPFRDFIGKLMGRFRLPYKPTFLMITFSGVSGAWFHIFFDSVLYTDIRPFYPFQFNPLYGLFSETAVYTFSAACFIPALVIYLYIVFYHQRNKDPENNPQ